MSNHFDPNSMESTLVRVETKLDIALQEQNTHRKDIEELKKWKWYTTGIASAFSLIISFFVDSFRGK